MSAQDESALLLTTIQMHNIYSENWSSNLHKF